MSRFKLEESESDTKAPPYRSMSIRQMKHHHDIPKITILIVIGLVFIIVFATSIIALLPKPDPKEHTMTQLNQLAKEYYEDYFYKQYSSSEAFKSLEDVNSAMDKYVQTGFPLVKLRQLILSNPTITKSATNKILQYCDAEKTYVIFYPESPFEQNSYHTEFTYSCTF